MIGMTRQDTLYTNDSQFVQRLGVWALDNLTNHQPHLVVRDHNSNAHVIPMYLVRQVASGEHIADNELSRVLAVALLDYLDGG